MGNPPAVGVDEDWARAPKTRALVAGSGSETIRTGFRLGLNRAAYRTLADNERAERLASSKRYF